MESFARGHGSRVLAVLYLVPLPGIKDPLFLPSGHSDGFQSRSCDPSLAHHSFKFGVESHLFTLLIANLSVGMAMSGPHRVPDLSIVT